MNIHRKTLCLVCALILFPSFGFAGTAKTGGEFEVMLDVVENAGSAPLSGGVYTAYQSVGQPSGYEIVSGNTYTFAGGFLGVVDETPPTILFSSPAAASNITGSVGVAGTAFDENGTQWTLYYGAGSAPTVWGQVASGTTNMDSTSFASWNASSLSGAYTLKIIAVDGRGNTAEGTVTFNVGNTATISGTIPKLKWLEISMPVQPSSSSPISLYGTNREYKVYRWNPDKEPDQDLGRYEYPDSLSAGFGYWVKVYYDDMPYSFSGTLIDTTTDYTIAVKEGWNQIGTPFNREFPWGQARVKYEGNIYDLSMAASMGLLSDTLTGYDGDARSWTQHDTSTQMEVKKGYEVLAYKNLELLFSPGAGRPGGLARVVRSPFDYRVKISAKANQTADLDNYFGAARAASKEFDTYDFEEPHKSPDDKYVSLYFKNDSWQRQAGRYANDVRGSLMKTGETEEWDFNVETNETGETITLTWDSSSLPTSQYSFTLVNLDTGERINMVAQSSYTYTATGGSVSTTHFKIEVVKLDSDKVTKTYTLQPGWNLISVPVEPEVTSALAQLGDDLPLLDVYQLYDGQYYVAENADIQAGLGYWVHVEANTQIDIEGLPVASEIRVPLKRGWNIVGNPFDDDLTWGDNIRVDVEGNEITLTEAVAGGVIDGNLYERDGDGYVTLGVGGALRPWRGYFVLAKKDCTLVLGR